MSSVINNAFSIIKRTKDIARNFATVEDVKIDRFLVLGQKITIDEREGGVFSVETFLNGDADGAGTFSVNGNRFNIVFVGAISSPKVFGAIGDGVSDDSFAWGAWMAWDGSKIITKGNYLVLGKVKTYTEATLVNTVSDNHSSSLGALESCVDGEGNCATGKDSQRKTNGIAPLASHNTSNGIRSMYNNEEGYRCTVDGFEALYSQVGNLVMGNSNGGQGYRVLYNNLTGKDNHIDGYMAMFFNIAGGGNTGGGYRVLYNNIGTDTGFPDYAAIDGSFNTCHGYENTMNNTYGKSISSHGWRATYNNLTGYRLTAAGQESLFNNIDGFNLLANGYQSMYGCVNGRESIGLGVQSLYSHTNPIHMVAVGNYSFYSSTADATKGVAVGHEAGRDNVSGVGLTLNGYRAAARSTSGNYITASGYMALEFTIAGGSNLNFSNCSGLGANTRVSAANQVQLGDTSTTTYAYGAVQDRSDIRDKFDPKDLTDKHISFFMDVEWKQYRMNYRDSYKEVEEYTDGEMEIVEETIQTGRFEKLTVKSPSGRYDMFGHEIIEDKEIEREIVKTEMVEREIIKTRIVDVKNDGSRAGKRYHIGAIAQQVEAAMKKHGIDFAGLQHHMHSGGEDIYSIGYQEFIGIQGVIIQKQQSRLLNIEDRLKARGI